jgi:hypothetical protein
VIESNWMRAAAAAAIVFVVVGGGWGVYSRVQPGQAGKVIVMPQRMPGSGGLSGAGAIRTPVTIAGTEGQGTRDPDREEACSAEEGRERSTSGRRGDAAAGGFAVVSYASFVTALISIPRSARTTAPQKAGPKPLT